MSDDQKHYGFNNGMPTGPEVAEVLGKWPTLTYGTELPRAELCALLGLNESSHRLRSVMDAVRRKLATENGLALIYDKAKQAYLIAEAADAIARTSSVTLGVARKWRNQRKLLTMTAKSATEAQKPVHQHQAILVSIMEREAKKTNMKLLPPSEIVAAVQMPIPKSSLGDSESENRAGAAS
jgi:hypothetical protein